MKLWADERILDCGHTPSPHDNLTTGTAHTPDGKEICWSCADDSQRRDLLADDRVILYYDGRDRTLVTWPGSRMMRVTSVHSRARWTPTGGYYSLYYLRATDSWDQEWYGTSPVPGMYAHMHKTAKSKQKGER